MPKIIELDSHVADLIAAGEVVERPASVLKELIENSIDAGAGVVTVEISAGGMTYMRITDNGCGIAPEDLKTAFLRHATSKLRNAEGLESIGTLGFRGEALAAIAAVSRIELLTREHGAKEGVRLLLEAGEVVDLSPVGCPEGTTIIVRDLFFNTPARLKFMKSDRAESSAAASTVTRSALAHPDVSVRFLRDGKTDCHTPGDSRTDSCIYSLLGREFSAGLLSAESSDEAVSVTGFVSSPDAARSNRGYQFFFVNGRPIRSATLQAALEQAYVNLLPSGRFPSCVLYIAVKPSDVDVNVHPAKTEVKFVSDKQVFESVRYAALGALERARASASLELDAPHVSEGVDFSAPTRAKSLPKAYSPKGGGGFKSMSADEFRSTHVSEGSNPYIGTQDNNGTQCDNSALHTGAATPYNGEKIRQAQLAPSAQLSIVNCQAPIVNCPSPPVPRVIGEALHTYIIVEYDDSVWFIDKHAAHERLHFNALKSENFEPMSQSLITPVVCRHGFEDVSLLLENAGLLDDLGFEAESFGTDAVAVRRIPAEIEIGDTEAVLSDICALLRLGGTAESANAANAKLDDIYKTVACKAAIKAGRDSGTRELEALAAKVMSGEVSHCPHGRPVAFEIAKATLDKGFKRS